MLLIDSSGWIEFFADGPLATQYSKYLKNLSKIVTPSIVIYEVYKKVKLIPISKVLIGLYLLSKLH